LSSQTAGSSVSRLSSVRRVFLVSKSKIPPQFCCPTIQIAELVGESVDLFCFHEKMLSKYKRELYRNDMQSQAEMRMSRLFRREEILIDKENSGTWP
jgi:hypothetical protein